ncbi:MAG: response regulator [Thermodesulfobacteriota bacterium]|nr:response regulator [Thermodesulfobacteriota bacterium]
MKILIVDDSSIARKMIRASIPASHKGHEFFEASDGRDAVEKYQSLRPDLVLMDLTMPDMDGRQAIEEIKKIDQSARIATISSNTQTRVIKSVIDKGAFTFIKKPVNAKTITDVLDKVEAMMNKTG